MTILLRLSHLFACFALLGSLGAGMSRAGEGTGPDRPPADAEAMYCTGGTLVAPVALYQPGPPGGVLLEMCPGTRLQRVAVRLDLDESGKVLNVELLKGSSCAEVDDEIKRCWSEWRYEPARCDGEPIEMHVFFTEQWGYGAAPKKRKDDYCPPWESVEDPENGSATDGSTKAGDPDDHSRLATPPDAG